jgi:hypothetical protein
MSAGEASLALQSHTLERRCRPLKWAHPSLVSLFTRLEAGCSPGNAIGIAWRWQTEFMLRIAEGETLRNGQDAGGTHALITEIGVRRCAQDDISRTRRRTNLRAATLVGDVACNVSTNSLRLMAARTDETSAPKSFRIAVRAFAPQRWPREPRSCR